VPCSKCGHENRETARFCEDCGSALVQRCSKCEAELRPGARFCDVCGQPIEPSPTTTAGPVAAEGAIHRAPTSVAAPQPTSFANGRYNVLKFLGEGGRKKVYLAHDASLDRDVAFALIKSEGLDAEARERITREAQAMGRLGTHPNIVTVYDIGEEPLGVGGQGPGAGDVGAQGLAPDGRPATQP